MSCADEPDRTPRPIAVPGQAVAPPSAAPESLEDVLVDLPQGRRAEPEAQGGAAGDGSPSPAPTSARREGAATPSAALGNAGPGSLAALFRAFTWLALQGFGGVLPVAQRELVERHRWLSREQFVEMLAVSQVLPGPNIVNLALMFGDRHFGVRGALTALAGMLLLPMVVVLALTALYGHYAHIPAVSGALRGMGAVAAGLVIATGFKLLLTLRRSALGVGPGLLVAMLMALGTGWLHWPLLWMLGGLGAVSCGIAWVKVGPAAHGR